ncbi:heme/hemin ABC transporter substrate-binding protein [Minwuia thermotolerans]|uniref:Hemin ABC transporter substrate-binding protein n=1 Tax=Minwuia thermotolerans TaxID=2056226 RepID=A0A2M9FVP7_9PROT|nr:ABC transporter substrate-binding protein [Minwuia thermotolerans]PJK27513.1 hemin ABC transporter substrate-binding protein [Minwuia thermotolerans]
MPLHAARTGRILLALGLLFGSVASAVAEPRRIVSAGGSVTEIVHALGAGDRLVGVDSTSFHPPEVRNLPDVGYLRALSAEPVLSLSPDMVLAEADAGPPEALTQLRAAGVEVVTAPDKPDIEGVAAKIETVAAALGREAAGEALKSEILARWAEVREAVAATGERPRVLFVLSTGSGAPLVAGLETSAAGIIEMAGGGNAIRDFTNFRPLTPEAGVALAPDVILVTRRTVDMLGGEAALLALPGLAATPAAEAGRVVAMDGLLLLGFGPRTPEAAARLARALHPDIELPAGPWDAE